MGFSQGGRLAAGLLRESQEGLLDDIFWPGEGFRFGLFSGASYPPIYASDKGAARWPHSPPQLVSTSPITVGSGVYSHQREHRPWDDTLEGAVRKPSIHIQGLWDPVLDMSKLLLRCFDEQTRKVFLLDIGHRKPTDPPDAFPSHIDLIVE